MIFPHAHAAPKSALNDSPGSRNTVTNENTFWPSYGMPNNVLDGAWRYEEAHYPPPSPVAGFSHPAPLSTFSTNIESHSYSAASTNTYSSPSSTTAHRYISFPDHVPNMIPDYGTNPTLQGPLVDYPYHAHSPSGSGFRMGGGEDYALHVRGASARPPAHVPRTTSLYPLQSELYPQASMERRYVDGTLPALAPLGIPPMPVPDQPIEERTWALSDCRAPSTFNTYARIHAQHAYMPRFCADASQSAYLDPPHLDFDSGSEDRTQQHTYQEVDNSALPKPNNTSEDPHSPLKGNSGSSASAANDNTVPPVPYPQLEYTNGKTKNFTPTQVTYGSDYPLSRARNGDFSGMLDPGALAFPNHTLSQKPSFRYSYQGLTEYTRQVNVVGTKDGKLIQPTRGRLAELAAGEMARFLVPQSLGACVRETMSPHTRGSTHRLSAQTCTKNSARDLRICTCSPLTSCLLELSSRRSPSGSPSEMHPSDSLRGAPAWIATAQEKELLR